MGVTIPPNYDTPGKTSTAGLLVAACFFGAAMTAAVFDIAKAGRQSHKSWGRSWRANAYVLMVWSSLSMSVTGAICNALFLLGVIQPSIGYFVGMRRW